MARIKIKDLSKDQKISRKEMRKLIGGASYSTNFTQFDAAGIKFSPEVPKALPVYGGSCGSIYFNIHESV